ncbi:MAG: Glycoside hydrolase, 38 vacuolar alpha mannosidase [Trizodia sp. TS-e1964]|nr:MAG: Glycoside hydrolase, 38 vacuolar alpha mannosidase [Trizodia sp. TS-e1964]
MGGESKTKLSSSIPKLAAGPVGQKIRNIYKDRLGQFSSRGQYERTNLLSKMDEGRAGGGENVQLAVYSPPKLSRPTFKEATSHEFHPTSTGQSFGPSWSTHWFKITIQVPSHLRDKKHLEFHWDSNSEGLIWTQQGEPVQGLTGGGERVEWILPDGWRDGKKHTFYIEMACNGMFGNSPGDSIQPPSPDRYFNLQEADIVAVNLEARALFIDFWIIGDAAREFPGDSWESHEALQVNTAIMDTFYQGEGSQESILECRKIAQKYLGENVDSAKVYDNDNEPLVYAIGNCHIDTCWLWPWDETKRKVARSWANQCDLLDRYPELRFACSQAQQYKWLKMYYPSLFDRVKAKVKQGQFQPIGGSWVEHDTNMPGGESLVRQFLYGQRFFESHFGERCTTFWLPDTFGYSGQLPQLCRLSGMTRFFTQKLSWNNINKFPHTTFNWVALDGSQVLCHMTPAETYTAEAHFGDVRRSITQHKSMDQDATSLLVFGKGDGGGGPTFQQIEKLRRCRGISDQIGLLPRVKMGDSVDDFFARLEQKAQKGTKYVTWYGELYFELHRGTYTTQGRTKRNNRKAENLMRDLEQFATIASLKPLFKTGNESPDSYQYPKQDIDDLWEKVLLCHFHDCLPGSSIEMCYDDSDKLYAEVFERGESLIKKALQSLGLRDLDASTNHKHKLVAINTLPWSRKELIKVPTLGPAHPSKYSLAGSVGHSIGLCSLNDVEPTATIKEVRKGVFQLENDRLTIEVERGSITSIYDRFVKRQVIPKGSKANQLVIFDDKPLYWQAWDVEVYHLETRQELTSGESTIQEKGPNRVSVVTTAKISEHSWVKTTVSLGSVVSHSSDDAEDYIDIDCEVEWRESMKFLKVEFPVEIRNTEASYETQFGVMKRPTHYNTSWDMAKFEVCCHKWADLSENGYGVSILNDSKYGFATCGNVMRLSLLRAPKAPDGNADMGRHHIRYAIFPHTGTLSSRTVRTAFNFNNPLRLAVQEKVWSTNLSTAITLVPDHDGSSLILDTIKRGEDDEDVSRGELAKRKGKSVILRIYESLGGQARGKILTTLPVKSIYKCNLLEDDEAEIEVSPQRKNTLGCSIELRGFEVATYRLQLEG